MTFAGTTQLPIQFSGGLNSKIAEFSLDQPNLQTADNAVYNQIGQADKRSGFTAISSNILGGGGVGNNSGTIINGQTITTFNNELLCMDGEHMYAYDSENDVWINKGVLFSTINDQIRVLNTKIATQANPDCTTLENLQLYVWEDDRPVPVSTGEGVRYSLMDTSTGSFIVSDRLIYAFGDLPKVIANGNEFNIYYQGSSSILFLSTVPVNQPQTITPLQEIIIDGYGTGSALPYDVALVNGVPNIVYSSTTSLGTPCIRIHVGGSPAGVDRLVISYFAAECVAICQGSTGEVWIAYSGTDLTDSTSGTWIANVTNHIVNIVQVDTQIALNITIIEDLNIGNVNISYECLVDGYIGYGINHEVKNAILQSDNTIVPVATQLKVGLASKAFKSNNNIFINTMYVSQLQATYFTQCVTQNMSVVAKHSPSNGGNFRNNSILSQCDPISPGNFVFAGQRKGPFTSYQNSQTVNLGVAGYTIDFTSADAFNNVSSNNNLHIVGGVKRIFDGISCVEDNFHVFPELSPTDAYSCSVVLESVPGGNLNYNPLALPNQYQWLAVYEWTDNFGQVQRSGPGIAATVVIPADGYQAIITVPTLTLTDKDNPRSPVAISIYRTQDSLPIFYKITNDNDPLVNDTTVDYISFTDNFSDSDIAANENLYTGTQLANTAPPSCSLISIYQNRIIINSTEDKNVLWYSQNKFEQDQYNTLALDFNTSFIEGITNTFGLNITAIAWLDNSLAIFKDNSIYILQGDGPNSLDTAGQFNDAQLIVSDTGCNNSNSIAFITQTPKLPGGLLFKSSKGIYLLGRDTTIYYIGAPVEQYNNLTITAANVITEKNEVVFSTLEGTTLVYNYFFDAWTTWSELPATNATVWQNQMVIITPNGQIMMQDITGTVWQDTFSQSIIYPVEMTITTPWIKLSGLQGYQACYNCLLLGTLQGPHILNVQIAFDYNPSIVESVNINATIATNRWGSFPVWGQTTGNWGNNQFANYQYWINFKNFRCEAVQMTFTDLDQVNGNLVNSMGYSLNGLVFEVLALPGSVRVPAANKFAAT